jgi:hypothetical protein
MTQQPRIVVGEVNWTLKVTQTTMAGAGESRIPALAEQVNLLNSGPFENRIESTLKFQ